MKFKKLSLLTGLIASLTMCTAGVPSTGIFADSTDDVSDNLLFSDDFEGEVISGWGILGGAGVMELDTANKQSGNASLKVSERTQPFNGPSYTLDNLIEAEETYRFSGWVYHNGSSSETINCTLRFSDSVNVDSYVGVATIEAEPSSWTYFEGSVNTPEDLSSTLLYFECANTDLAFSIDDIQIFGNPPAAAAENDGNAPAAAEHNTTSYVFDFEGGFGEWVSRGDTRLIRTDEQHLSGNYSLCSTNRQKVWNGPTVDIDGIQRGVEYTYETNVLYNDKKADETHTFLLQLQYNYNGNEVYEFISSAEVTKNVWTKISGPFTVPEGATNVHLYVQTDNLPEDETESGYTDLVSFYIDDTSAIRSDLIGAAAIPYSTIIVIASGVIVLIFLILLIKRAVSSGSSKDEETETAETVMNVFDQEHNVTGNVEDKNEKEPAKSETAADKNENKPDEVQKAADNKSKNSTAEKNKKSESGNDKNSKSSEKSKSNQSKSSKKPADDIKKEADKKEKTAETPVPEKSREKAKENSKEEPKEKQDTPDDSRARDIFNIETFSYEEETVKYDESSDSPLDSPFDGF